VGSTRDGEFIRELMPLEQVEHDEIDKPIWWRIAALSGKGVSAETFIKKPSHGGGG